MASGVGEVERGDGTQVRVVETVASVVLVGDGAEDVGPHETGALTVVAHPGGRAEMRGRLVPGHGLLELDAQHQRAVVVARPQVGHGREQGHTAGRTGGLVPRSGQAPQVGTHRRRHGAEVALSGEELAEGVADVDDLDVGRSGAGRLEGAVDDLADEVGDVMTLAGQVAREVRLGATEHPDPRPGGARAAGRHVRLRSRRRRRCPEKGKAGTVLQLAESLAGAMRPIRAPESERPRRPRQDRSGRAHG